MNISITTASFPIDMQTLEEIKGLCNVAFEVDGYHYENTLNMALATDYEAKGFFVLAYNDDTEELVGVASAIDVIGLQTYEWSMVVAPMYRRIGIGTALASVMQEGFAQRGAEGELALIVAGAPYGQTFMERMGYAYSFSEATLEAKAEALKKKTDVTIRRYENEHAALVEIFGEAFGDLPEESEELIAFNTSTEGRVLWIACLEEKVVGTVTSAKEGDVQWVTALAVHPDFEGQGIGTALLAWIKDYAFQNGEHFVMLDVEIENEKALRVYEKVGFLTTMQIDYFAKK